MHTAPPTVVEQAEALYKEGKVAEAIPLLQQQITHEPQDMAARELLGDIYFAQDQYKEARQQYRYLCDRRRYAVSAALKLVEVYLCLPKKLRQAYNVLRRTVAHNPAHLTALLRYANFCRVLIREEEEVAALYARAEELSAGDLEQTLELAGHYVFTEQWAPARAACARALEWGPNDSRVYHLLYAIYLAMGLWWLADAALRRALDLAGPSVQCYHDQAMLEIAAGNPAVAMAALRCALDCTSAPAEQGRLWQQLALLQMQQAAYPEAIHSLHQALLLSPGDVTLLYALVAAHQQMLDYQAALQVLDEHLLPVVGDADRTARYLQGILVLAMGDGERAVRLFADLVQADPQNADYHYSLACAYHHCQQLVRAKQSVTHALRCDPRHTAARALHAALHQGHPPAPPQEPPAPASPYFDPLELEEFLEILEVEQAVQKLSAYLESRYWKQRDPRGCKPRAAYRTLVRMLLVMGIKDWTFNALYTKLRSRKHGGPLRRLMELPDDPAQLADYTSYKRRLNALGGYPLRFLMNTLVRTATSQGYIDVTNVILDSSLLAASSDLARYFPDSPTGFSETDAGWSYPKPWTGRVFGFKLALATAADGEPIDAAVVPANPHDITLGKQAVRRLGRLFAPLDIKVEFVLGDSGYCSNPLRDLVKEVLGAVPLFYFNPRNGAAKQPQYTYLDDQEAWLKTKRKLRSLIERSFAQLKLHFGLNNLRIRGLTQVTQYILSRCIAYLACVIVAHRVDRPDLKASPNRLLWSC